VTTNARMVTVTFSLPMDDENYGDLSNEEVAQRAVEIFDLNDIAFYVERGYIEVAVERTEVAYE
jgi:hypothetical protein